MSVKIGEPLPKCELKTMLNGQVTDVDISQLFATGKGVLFGVPGAFTPGCSKNHLPSYVNGYEAIRDQGFDTIACMAVNDVWVMSAWGKSAKADGKVLMLADGSAICAKRLGLELDLNHVGMGMRCKRFSMIIEDGIVQQINIDGNYIETTSAAYTCGLSQ